MDWDYGDGSVTDSGVTTQHRFTSVGVYNVVLSVTDSAAEIRTATQSLTMTATTASTVTVTDSAGQTKTATAGIDVNLVQVTASFTATNTTTTGDFVVNFNASGSTGSVLTYTWDFADGTLPVVNQPVPTITHTFADALPCNVTLTVTDVAGTTASVTLSVTPD